MVKKFVRSNDLLQNVIELLLVLADTTEQGRTANSVELMRTLDRPRRHSESMFQHLSNHGMIEGKRGPTGGYRLVKSPKNITVQEICSVLSLIPEWNIEVDTRAQPLFTRMQHLFSQITLEELRVGD